MSSTPPEQPGAPQHQSGGGYGYGRPQGPTINLSALMPTPGNAELVVYILATIIVAIITLASKRVDASGFVTAFTVMTLAYLVSRGIAKASRVLER